MTGGMAELRKDPKVIASAQKRLVPGERILWAARQRGIGKRGLAVFAAVALWTIALSGLATLISSPSLTSFLGFMAFWFTMSSPFLGYWTLQTMSRRFLVTDRRVLFVSGVWPFRWAYWNHSELDVHWLRFGTGRNVIHFKPFMRGLPDRVSQPSSYPNYAESIPDIEAVRETILAQIALNPEPVEEADPRKRPRPPVHGTRTG
jgi:hypothetical protein